MSLFFQISGTFYLDFLPSWVKRSTCSVTTRPSVIRKSFKGGKERVLEVQEGKMRAYVKATVF